jgi:signal transduction histidine kinase
MSRFRDNIVGVVGLVACLAIGLLDSIGNSWVLGPRLAISIPRLDATFAAQLAAAFVSNIDNVPAATLRVHLVLRLIFVIIFATALWVRTNPTTRRTPSLDMQLLGVQIFVALIGRTELVHVVAAELAIVLTRDVAWRWLGLLVVADVAVKIPYLVGAIGDMKLLTNHSAVVMCIAWDSVTHPVFFGMGLLVSAERRGRAQLVRAHAELLATQQLLADAIRASERARIARDLHDALGHHLTALNLHLDLATRQVGMGDSESLQISRKLAQGLLAEVRATVNIHRRQRAINLRQALETLCTGIPFPCIALSYDERIQISEPTLADTVFRTVQEAITNAVRHSGASEVNINLHSQNDGLAISVSDDGGGAARIEEGNGLSGIRQRVETLGGWLRTATRARGGFSLHVWLPRIESAS